MKKFDIYTRNYGSRKAVKIGWSWPAFFFGSLWAICMKLWLIGLFFLSIELIMQTLISITEKIQRNASGTHAEITGMIEALIFILILGARIVNGYYGNSWKRTRLERTGYSHGKTIQARNKKSAIYLATKN